MLYQVFIIIIIYYYLGSIISNDAYLDKEIVSRISKASQALGRTRIRVLNQHNICLSTKLKVYSAVLTSILYECKTWKLYRRQIKQLEKFHMRALRSTIKICWQHCITSLEVLERANSTSTEAMLIKAQLCWVGHVVRMDINRIPHHLLCGELTTGKRNQCHPRKQFKDIIKANLQWCNIHPKELEIAPCEQSQW